jgi:plastocyanin
MDNSQPIKRKINKALILIIIVSLLTVFIVTVSLLMAKNINGQKNNIVKTETERIKELAATIPAATPEKALEKAKLQEEQRLNPSQASSTSTSPAGEETRPARDLININISGKGFVPTSFSAAASTKINVTLTNTSDIAHSLTFSDPVLAGNNTTIEPNQTKNILIHTPATPGTYAFSCTTAGHNGEIGKMIIK